MAIINKTVVVCQEADDFMAKMIDLVSVLKAQITAGWNMADIPADVAVALKDLVPALQDASNFKVDLSADPVAFAKAIELGATDLVASLLK